LGRTLLAGYVQDRPRLRPAGRDAGSGLEEERGLADTGLPSDEDEGSGNNPAAENAVELRDPDLDPVDFRVAHR
jgi:hypothetical protein